MYYLTSLHMLRFGIQFYTLFSNIPDQRSDKSGPFVHYIHPLTGTVSVIKCGWGKFRIIFEFKMFRHEPLTVEKFCYPWMVT